MQRSGPTCCVDDYDDDDSDHDGDCSHIVLIQMFVNCGGGYDDMIHDYDDNTNYDDDGSHIVLIRMFVKVKR